MQLVTLLQLQRELTWGDVATCQSLCNESNVMPAESGVLTGIPKGVHKGWNGLSSSPIAISLKLGHQKSALDLTVRQERKHKELEIYLRHSGSSLCPQVSCLFDSRM